MVHRGSHCEIPSRRCLLDWHESPTNVATPLLVLAFLCVALPQVNQALGDDPTRQLLFLTQGPDGHPPSTHEFDAGVRVMQHCLQGYGGLEMRHLRLDGDMAEVVDGLAWCDSAVLFASQGARWMAEYPEFGLAMERLAAQGGGFVGLHWALGSKDAAHIEPFVALFGGCHGGSDRRFQKLETDLVPADGRHQILEDLEPLRVHDEFYYQLKFVTSPTAEHPNGPLEFAVQPGADPANADMTPILRATIDGEQETVAWAWQRPDGGRSFGFTGLHYHKNWREEPYRRVVTGAIYWTLRLPFSGRVLQLDVPEGVYELN